MKTDIYNFNLFYTFMLILGICIPGLYACNPRSENDLQQEHTNTYLSEDELEGYAAWQKEQVSYTKIHQDLLKKVDNRIELLEEKMDEMSLKQQEMAREDIRHLDAQRVTLQDKLYQLEEANEHNWAELKQQIDQVADSLEFDLEKLDKNVEFGSIWLIHL